MYLFFYASGNIKIYMLIYVDDMIIIGTHPHVIKYSFIRRMQQEFRVL